MKRKVFYSMVEKDKITGIKKRDGYKLNINGEKFNAFKSKTDGMVYIIDPKSGIALIKYHPDWNGNIPTVLELIDQAKEKLVKSGILEKWKEMRKRESYQLAVEMFETYKRAESLMEKRKEAVNREMADKTSCSSKGG